MELLYLCSPLTYCLVCVLQPCVHVLGKGLRPASPVRQVQHLLDPLFCAEYAIHRVPLSRFVFFLWAYLWFYLIMRQLTETLRTLRMSLIDFAKVLKQAVTEIWVMGRVAGKPKVVAFQQQRRRPACAAAQTGQRLCCSISGKYNW